jgi:hypothetical protein
MKKFVIIILISIFVITSCTNEEKKVMEIKSIEKVEQVDTTVDSQESFANPAFIYGSDFMSFMQSLRKVGNYELMLKFTASESIKKIGTEKIKAFYEEKFTNMSKLDLKSVTDNADGSKTMNYVNLSVATKSATSIVIVIENDSCKIILPTDLKKKLLN